MGRMNSQISNSNLCLQSDYDIEPKLPLLSDSLHVDDEQPRSPLVKADSVRVEYTNKGYSRHGCNLMETVFNGN